ncbi:ATP-binding protein [Streptomyces bomunensis]|uniref:ATP-binding protein n=1 Tax=Streptomyces montanisoli TaxID=2798581 RepID=A0A940M9L9_9ACTN|nr:ATP-binding protein [Streptomyces montanisoli]
MTREGWAPEGPGPHGTLVADALLITSELVTNALRHGGGLTGFTATVEDGCLVVTAADASTRVPVPRAPGGAAGTGGYGWPLMRRLAGTPDVTVSDAGKTVRVAMPLSARPDAATSLIP